jgi:hypothetical protein
MADDKFQRETEANPGGEEAAFRPKITGNIPPAMRAAMKQVRGQREEEIPKSQARPQGSAALEDLIEGLKPSIHVYEEVKLPSLGVFYDGQDGPQDGLLHIRPMTGEEEQILATPRFVRKGQAINMIFARCLQEHFKTEQFLSIDRTYLLIWLRGISYSHEYDVEVKCPNCDRKFQTTLNLNSLTVNECPSNFSPPLSGTLPKSKYGFNYRLSRGSDETAVQEYRDKQLKMWGDSGADDTLLYRTAMLLDDIEGLKDKRELMMLLKKLPIQDVSYLRSAINEPPFGVDTKCEIVCGGCLSDFEVDMPLEANFFFPRHKRRKEDQPA